MLLVGGLGYLYLGQRAKAGRAFALVLALVLLNAWAAAADVRPASMALGPAILVFQVLTALDAWILARAAREGDPVGRRSTRVPALLRLMGSGR